PVSAIEEEQVQKVAEHQPARFGIVEIGRGELLRRRPAIEVSSTREQIEARLHHLLAIHLGEPHLQHHLLALAATGDLEQVDYLRLWHRGGRDLRRPEHHLRARYAPGEDRGAVIRAHRDVFAWKQ